MHTILVPLDGSLLAESALPVAAGIAARTGASLALASVHEPGLPVRGGQGAMVFDQRWDADVRAALQAGLDAARRRVAALAPGVAMTSVVLDGAVAPTLAAHATSLGADLIVLTSHGRGGSGGPWLGNVTDKLVRLSRIPLLVLPADGAAQSGRSAEHAFRRVLVPLDGWSACEGAIAASAAVAGREGVRYTLLRVAPPLHPLLQAVVPDGEVERDSAEQRELAECAARDAGVRLQAGGFDVCGIVRMDLQPARAIHAVAEEIGADLIAIATHGRGPFGRLLLGSVMDKVLRGAKVPVLVHRIVDEASVADEQPASESDDAELLPVPARPDPSLPTSPAPQLDRVVVALDFAEPSRNAAAWTARHLAPAAELVLVHAVCVPEPPAFIGQSASARRQILENVHRGADARMRELVPALGAPRVWPEIREGAPHVEIRKVSAAYQADLIVIGAQGERSGLSAFLGTTAQRVVRTASVPVLLARALPDGPPRRLLAAIDGSPATDQVLAWATFLGARFGAEVVLLHVVSHLMSGAVALGASELETGRTLNQTRDTTSGWLEGKARACRESVATVTTCIGVGDPAPEILERARRAGADLIIVGRGDAGPVARTFLGSTAERVLRHSDRPVLVTV